MKLIKSIFIAIAISFFSITACEEAGVSDEKKESENPQFFSEYLDGKVSKNFIGIAVDVDENPLANVAITIGNKTVITDSTGSFVIKNANVNANWVSIEAKKEDYKNTILSIVPSNDTSKVSVRLNKENKPCLFWFCKRNHSLPNSQ